MIFEYISIIHNMDDNSQAAKRQQKSKLSTEITL